MASILRTPVCGISVMWNAVLTFASITCYLCVLTVEFWVFAAFMNKSFGFWKKKCWPWFYLSYKVNIADTCFYFQKKKKKKKKKKKWATKMALVTYVTLLVGRTTIHWHFVSNKRTRVTEPKNIKERNQKTKHKNSKYKSWNSEMFISLMVSELSLYDGLVQYGLYVRGINRSQVFQVICSSP